MTEISQGTIVLCPPVSFVLHLQQRNDTIPVYTSFYRIVYIGEPKLNSMKAV